VPSFAGLADRTAPLIMGIVNITPDSFSDGGLFFSQEAAITQGERLLAEGADILDIGGESTRPGAPPVSEEEEARRILPAIEALAKRGACLSVDTRHAATMARALDAGARIVNDVSGLRGEGALALVAARNVPVVVMHMRGEPATMQDNPTYDDVVGDIIGFFGERIAACREAGIRAENICLDPGIGFGKSLTHNLALLRHLGDFAALGFPVLLGASRKSFLAHLDRPGPASERIGGSIAAALHGAEAGVAILRVHDVAATRQALTLWRSIR
jgi:dihydropteroate synthase